MLASYGSHPWAPYLLFGGMAALQGLRSVRRHGSSRRLAVSQFAEQHDLAFGDTTHLSGLPAFTSLEALIVDQWGIENSLLGTWQGVQLLAGDLWSRDPSPDGGSSSPPSYRSVAIVQSAGRLPFVRIRRVSGIQQAVDTAAGVRVRFESEEFNRSFQVDADSNETAFKVVDERMMQWLLGSGGSFTFETGTGGVLVISDLVDPSQLETFLDAAAGFAAHVPHVAAIAPSAAAATGGTSTPLFDAGAQSISGGSQSIPAATMVTSARWLGSPPPGSPDVILRSPSRVVIQSNIFGFHSSDSVAGDELRNAFQKGTWSRDPHLRRFVLRQGAVLLLPILAIGLLDGFTYGSWLPVAVTMVSLVFVLISLTKFFHRS
jgi:hypothetical protein